MSFCHDNNWVTNSSAIFTILDLRIYEFVKIYFSIVKLRQKACFKPIWIFFLFQLLKLRKNCGKHWRKKKIGCLLSWTRYLIVQKIKIHRYLFIEQNVVSEILLGYSQMRFSLGLVSTNVVSTNMISTNSVTVSTIAVFFFFHSSGSSKQLGERKVVTTDLHGGCTKSFTGNFFL